MIAADTLSARITYKTTPMSTISVRINEDLVESARAVSKAEFRTVQVLQKA